MTHDHQRRGDAPAPPSVSLFAVLRPDGTYFAGFDPARGAAATATDPLRAKLYTNRWDISLRPDERLVEIIVELTPATTLVTPPFRPRRRDDVRVPAPVATPA